MATKKSSKSTKTKNTKIARATKPVGRAAEPFHKTVLDAIVIALAIVITGSIIAVATFFISSQKTHEEQQKLIAFDKLVQGYLDGEFYEDGKRTATVTGSGMTEDNDLYYDFVINTYENNIPMTYQKARLHFQCHEQDNSKLKNSCSRAYWYDEVHETSSDYREKTRIFNETTENYVNAANAAETEEQKAALKKEYEKFVESSYKDFNWQGLE